ncbi:MAG: SH3 domain-containing protein [Adhaeribacter sp.]
MAKSVFRIFDFPAFLHYLRATTFLRRITVIQNHHTWKPNYTHFNFHNPKYLVWLESMRNDHMQNRHWSDIGQNLTLFPDGMIGLCRSLDLTPAGIFGANAGAICLEHFGNFDEGGDQMSLEQRQAIIQVNAALCLKFNLQPQTHQVVYHHWYDTRGKRFSQADIDSGRVLRNKQQKTCPGTNFFASPQTGKGNTILSAKANFYPLIAQEMARQQGLTGPFIQPVSRRVLVHSLNVRAGRGTGYHVIRCIPKGLQVQVYETEGGWCRVSLNAEEWVSAKFLA